MHLYPQYYDHGSWSDREREIIGVHFNYLKDLADRKILFMAGRTINEPMTDKDFGIAIIEADSEEEARRIMENDPAIKNKLMLADFFEFSLAIVRG